MTKRFKKILALVLGVMVAGTMALVPEVASATECYNYPNYVCLGDNIANGINATYADDINEKGFGLHDGYYKTVSSKTGIPAVSYAHNGYRAAEVRELLDTTFSNTDAYATKVSIAGIYDLELEYSEDMPEKRDEVISNIQKGGIVTVECGTMDLLVMPLIYTLEKLDTNVITSIAKDALGTWWTVKVLDGVSTEEGEKLVKAALNNEKFVACWKEGMEEGAAEFNSNIEPIVEKINGLSNGKSNIFLVNVYINETTISSLDLGNLVSMLEGVDLGNYIELLKSKGIINKLVEQVDVVNSKMSTLADTKDYCEYVNIKGIETDNTCLPSKDGYNQIAGKIVEKIPSKQHNLTHVAATVKSCTTNGNTEYWKCSDCGKYYSDANGDTEIGKDSWIIPAAHKLTKTNAKAATCLDKGNNEYWTCSECGGVFKDEEGKTSTTVEAETLAKTNHIMTKTDAHAESCTADGNKAYWTCSNDCCKGRYYLEEDGSKYTTDKSETVVAKHAHNLTKTAAKAATCLEKGNNEYWTCSECEGVFKDEEGTKSTTVEDETLAKTNHSMTKTDAHAESCTEDGNKEYWTCSNECCAGIYYLDANGSSKTENKADITIAKHHDLEKVAAKAATCTQAGNNEYYKCTKCDAVFKDADGTNTTTKVAETIAALGHQMTHHEAKAESCDKDGNIEYWTCGRECCNGIYYLDANGSSKTENKADITIAKHHTLQKVAAKAATCTASGNKEYYKCTKCEAVFKDASGTTATTVADETIAALGHDMNHHAKVDETCTTDGTKEYWTCSNECCKGKYYLNEAGTSEATEAELKIAKHHTLEKVDAKAATCIASGNKEYYKCTKCTAVFKDADGTTATTVAAETITALGHNMTHHAKVDETCEADGTKEHWTCSNECCNGKYYLNEAGTSEATEAELKIAKHHTLQKVAANAATCTDAGNNEYYKCTKCDAVFKDANGTTATTIADETIPAGHDYDTSWQHDATKHWQKCKNCDAITSEAEHTWPDENSEDGWSKDDTYHWHECTVCGAIKDEKEAHTGGTATCTEKKTCEKCGQAYGEYEPHNYGELIEQVDATATTSGMKAHYQCSECNKFFDTEYNETTEAALTIAATGGGSSGGGAAPAEEPQQESSVTVDNSGNVSTDVGKSAEVKKEGDQTIVAATVTADAARELVEAAKANNQTEITINAASGASSGSDTKSELTVPTELIADFAKADSGLESIEIKTDAAKLVVIDKTTLQTIAKEAGTAGEVKLEIARTETTEDGTNMCKCNISITAGGKTISEFNGGTINVEVSVPKELKGKDLDVLYIDDNKRAHEIENKQQDKTNNTFIFTITHNSCYAIMEQSDAAKILADQAVEDEIAAVQAMTVKVKSAKALSNGKITVSWNKASGHKLTYYRIYRATSKSGQYTKVGTVKSSKLLYTDSKKLKKNKKYYYKVCGAVKIDGVYYETGSANVKYAKCKKTRK